MRIRLFTAELRYGSGLVLHTAASGIVRRLEEIYLLLEDEGACGVGEVRANASYLNGVAAPDLLVEIQQASAAVAAASDPGTVLAAISGWRLSAPARMLIESALRDLRARQSAVSVAESLAGAALPLAAKTNQTLFWSPVDEFRARAAAYVERGFGDLKVRVGVGSFEEDLARLRWLRTRFGRQIEIAVDANGAWAAGDAQARIEALAELDVGYVEQPVAAEDWGAIEMLAEQSPLPVMLDESLARDSDIEKVCAIGGRLEAHVKLLKFGGIGAALKAARRLTAAGVPVMVGQMNEGAAATAAALHLAVAASAGRAELYGADGIENDPVCGLVYDNGRVAVSGAIGLGVEFDPAQAQLIMETGR